MKRPQILRHFAFAFLLALGLYVLAFYWIEGRRVAREPWSVSFTCSAGASPSIVVQQANYKIRKEIVFEDADTITNDVAETITFGTPRPVPFSIPFGQCVFLDTTFLPGTVTLRCFGHEIEMIPRVLIVDHQEFPWSNTNALRLKVRAGSS